MTTQTASKPATKLRAKLPVANTDLTVERREAVFHLPAGLASGVTSMLRDKRDLQLVEALLSILLIVPTSAALVFLAPWWQLKVVLGLLHVPFVFVLFAARFILGLHYWSHAPRGSVWVKGMPFASVLQAIPTVLIAPFFGIPAGMYYLHHVAMHHRDNNMAPADLSSTMPYQRNSLLGFLHYWARYFFFALFELPLHSLNVGNYRLLAQGVASAAFFLAKVYLLMQVDAIATVFVFVLPFFVASLALMFGNWSQHIFVDPDAYEDGVAKDPDAVNYSLTFNCMNSPENGMTFNDGYHIIHHRWASLHWAELPQKCIDDIEAHAKNDALIFSDADPMAIGLAVMSGNWDWVVSRYVHYGQTPVPRTPKEIEAELKRRLSPIQCGPSKPKAL